MWKMKQNNMTKKGTFWGTSKREKKQALFFCSFSASWLVFLLTLSIFTKATAMLLALSFYRGDSGSVRYKMVADTF